MQETTFRSKITQQPNQDPVCPQIDRSLQSITELALAEIRSPSFEYSKLGTSVVNRTKLLGLSRLSWFLNRTQKAAPRGLTEVTLFTLQPIQALGLNQLSQSFRPNSESCPQTLNRSTEQTAQAELPNLQMNQNRTSQFEAEVGLLYLAFKLQHGPLISALTPSAFYFADLGYPGTPACAHPSF